MWNRWKTMNAFQINQETIRENYTFSIRWDIYRVLHSFKMYFMYHKTKSIKWKLNIIIAKQAHQAILKEQRLKYSNNVERNYMIG